MRNKVLSLSALALTTIFAGHTAKADAHYEDSDHESPIVVTLSGKAVITAGFVDIDDEDNTRDVGSDVDASVLLTAEGQTEDGFVYGLVLELAEDAKDEDANSKYYAYVEDEWGHIDVGSVDGAIAHMLVSAPNSFGTGGALGDQYYQFAQDSLSGSEDGYDSVTLLDKLWQPFDSEGANKLSYYSPRYAGFQLGVSYAPSSTAVNDLDRTDGATGFDHHGNAAREAFEDFTEVAVHYQDEVDGVEVQFSLAYSYAQAFDQTNDFEDLHAYQAGLSLSTMGWTFGAGYVYQGDSGYAQGANDDDTYGINVGVQYETGPFIIGANMLMAEGEGDVATQDDAEYDAYSIGAEYLVVPGMSTFVEGVYATTDGDYGDRDATVIMAGTKFEF